MMIVCFSEKKLSNFEILYDGFVLTGTKAKFNLFLDCFKRFMTGNPSRTPLQVENNVRPRPGTVKF